MNERPTAGADAVAAVFKVRVRTGSQTLDGNIRELIYRPTLHA